MRHFYDEYQPRRSGFFGTLLVAIISAVVGGIIALSFFPYFYPGDKVPGGQVEGGQLFDREQEGQQQQPQPIPLPAGENPVIAIADRVGPTVVAITNIQESRSFFSNPHSAVSSGSGVIFDSAKGHIVTNFHVVDGADRLIVTLDEERQYEAEFIAGDQRTDLAVVRINANNLPEAKFGDSSKLRVGETAIAIGNPLGRFARSVTVGVISALNRELTVQSGTQDVTLQLLQTDAAINPGNSGGALVNVNGEVIGINSAKIGGSDVEGLGFAIPISDARPIIDQLLNNGYVSRPYIGIKNFFEITPQMAEWYNEPVGIYVQEVIIGGPAMEAGMEDEDIIIAMGGEDMETTGDLYSFLNRHKPGEQVTVMVMRQGKKVKLELILGEMPR